MMKQSIKLYFLSVFVLLTVLTGNLICSFGLIQKQGTDNPFPQVKPESVGIKPETLKFLSGRIEYWLEKEEIVGAVLMIIKARKTVFHEAYGWQDKEREIPMQKDTICRMRSMTKPYVGTSILMLQEQKKLDLSDKMAEYVASFRNEKCRDITIEHLITHTGGFTQPGYPGSAANYKSLESLVKTIGSTGPTYKPGERYFYSDAGSSTLAYIVTVFSGMPVEDYIQKNILEKLGMTDTFCNLTKSDPRRLRVSCTYSGGKGKWRKYWDNSNPQAVPYFRGSGGIYSTTADYARFMAMWMDRGEAASQRFLTSETTELALTSSLLTKGDDSGYGFQWQIHKESPLTFGHGGSDGTIAIAIPEDDLIFLYFTQSRGNRTLNMMHAFFTLSFLNKSDQ